LTRIKVATTRFGKFFASALMAGATIDTLLALSWRAMLRKNDKGLGE
jgi:hypothetical protein